MTDPDPFLRRCDAVRGHRSRWHHSPAATARLLGYDDDRDGLAKFLTALEKGFSGKRGDESHKINPVPYQSGIALQYEAGKTNQLFFHYEKFGGAKTKYYSFGRDAPRNKVVALKRQVEMCQKIVGEFGRLAGKLKTARAESWRRCIVEGKIVKKDRADLHGIIKEYKDIWVTRVDIHQAIDGEKEEDVRLEIIQALKCLGYLPFEEQETIFRRLDEPAVTPNETSPSENSCPNNSPRGGPPGTSVVSGAKRRMSAGVRTGPGASPSKGTDERSKRRQKRAGDETDFDEAVGEEEQARRADAAPLESPDVNLSSMKKLWDSGEDGRILVGKWEIAYSYAHENRSWSEANQKIVYFDQLPLSKGDWERVFLDKRVFARKSLNFDELKKYINESQLFKIGKDDFILGYLKDCKRFNSGLKLPREMMKTTKTGGNPQLTTEAGAIIRHILHDNPFIGYASFNILLQYFSVLLCDRVLTEKDYPSISTIRHAICRLDNIDLYELGQMVLKCVSSKSEYGNRIMIGAGSDDTKHDKKDAKSHFYAIVGARDPPDPDNPYLIDPFVFPLTAGRGISSTSDGNATLNVESMAPLPTEVMAAVSVFSSDQAPDALKEGRLTIERAQETAKQRGCEEQTLVNGVKVRPINIPDTFHNHQNSAKHFSEAAMGKTEAGSHEQVHHRQFIQNDWDIFIRSPGLYYATAKRILGDLWDAEDGFQPSPKREINTRFGSNGRACATIVQGYYIRNEEGVNFWTLLYSELKDFFMDFRSLRCQQQIEMILNESIVTNLHIECEVGLFFNAHENFHNMPGELCEHATFKTLELPFELLDHSYPFWSACRDDWTKHLVLTSRYLDSLESEAEAATASEKKRLQDIVKLKKEQIDAGVKAGSDELLKLVDMFYDPGLLVLFFTHPIYGPCAARAMLQRAQLGGLDLDEVFEHDVENASSIDANMTWQFLAEDSKTDWEKACYAKLDGKESDCIHYLRQHGFTNAKIRNDLKSLVRELGGFARSNDSDTRLMDFREVHEAVFDCIHSAFALTFSATRIFESAHGFNRENWCTQRPQERIDNQIRYMMITSHEQRFRRRGEVYSRMDADENEFKEERRSTVSHKDSKPSQILAGEQLQQMITRRYTSEKLKARIPDDVLAANAVSVIVKGSKLRKKDIVYDAKAVVDADQRQVKRRRNKRSKKKTVDEAKQSARNLEIAHDRDWRGREQKTRKKAMTDICTKTWWKGVPLTQIEGEMRRVIPLFWKTFKKHLQKHKGKRTAALYLKAGKASEGDNRQNNLGMFLQLVKNIAKGKAEDVLSTKARAKQLREMKATEYDLLSEFVLVDESHHHEDTLTKTQQRIEMHRDIARATGSTISSHAHWNRAHPVFEERTVKFVSTESREARAEEVAAAMGMLDDDSDDDMEQVEYEDEEYTSESEEDGDSSDEDDDEDTQSGEEEDDSDSDDED